MPNRYPLPRSDFPVPLLWSVPSPLVPPTPPRRIRRGPLDADLTYATLHLIDLCQAVVGGEILHPAPVPESPTDLLALIEAFLEQVNLKRFPIDPRPLDWFSGTVWNRIDMSLMCITPAAVGVPCRDCEPPPPGDLVHLIQTLECLSLPGTPDSRKAAEAWRLHYADRHIPHRFTLETACLCLEERPLTAPFCALPLVIRHALGCTGNWFLDACPHCWWEGESAWHWPDDDASGMEDVEWLTRAWTEAQSQYAAIRDFHDWMSAKPAERICQVIDRIWDAFHAANSPHAQLILSVPPAHAAQP